jgi:hypothetical protein
MPVAAVQSTAWGWLAAEVRELRIAGSGLASLEA